MLRGLLPAHLRRATPARYSGGASGVQSGGESGNAMAMTVDQFVETLTEHAIVSAELLREARAALTGGSAAGSGDDAAALSRTLVDAGWLTPYQAQAALDGQVATLRVGDYVVLHAIGAGGSAQVFKARHRETDHVAAIKLLAKARRDSKVSVKRFLREAEAAARVRHPNIVAAYDAGLHNHAPYLVMEYVEGRDLDAIISETGPLSVDRAVDYVSQAARGLAFAHAHGVIHRDVKPSNILLDAAGAARVLDLGTAHIDMPDHKSNAGLTSTGGILGTAYYMAPEQAENAKGVDERADIYSLGCTLFKLITGDVPYEGKSAIEVLVAHRIRQIPSMLALCPDVPPRVQAVFERMVAKDVADRYPTMTQTLDDLDALRRAGD
ncbi:MAG: protein kinase [Phycisphaera sp.]|nr:protein kinase [Phycisphaera sp.]